MYLNRGRSKPSGFTLAEIMVVAAIVAIIAAAVICIFVAGKRTWFISSAQVATQQAARNAIDRMSRELIFSSPLEADIGTSGDTITFRIPASVGADGDITWTGTIQYSLNAGQIIRTMASQTDVLANNIQALQFSPLGSRGIELEVTAQKYTLDGRNIEYPLSSQLYYRNE